MEQRVRIQRVGGTIDLGLRSKRASIVNGLGESRGFQPYQREAALDWRLEMLRRSKDI